MRFSTAWAKIAQENVALKWATISLTVISSLLGLLVLREASTPPLVVERECRSRVLKEVDGVQTAMEVEAFVREAVHERFDTDSQASKDFLSLEEIRAKEQTDSELKSRKMTQHVLVVSVNRNSNAVEVDADRLISAGEIRSAFHFPLVLTLASVARTENNPYGLVLVRTEPKKGTNFVEGSSK